MGAVSCSDDLERLVFQIAKGLWSDTGEDFSARWCVAFPTRFRRISYW